MTDHEHHHHDHPKALHHDHQAHAHGEHCDDHWDGEAYLSRAGVREAAAINAENVATALNAAGIPTSEFSNLSVLEVGCGPGLVTEHLAKTYGSVHAIETSVSQLETFALQPAAKAKNVTWGLVTIRPGIDLRKEVLSPTCDDGRRMKAAPRNHFDVVVVNLVVHHVDDLVQFFGGIMSVTKPGGIVVITEFTVAEDGRDVIGDMRAKATGIAKEEADKDIGNSVNAPGHFHQSFTVDTLGEQLNIAGFVNIKGARCKPVPLFVGEELVPIIYVYGFKSDYEGGATLQREPSHRENRKW